MTISVVSSGTDNGIESVPTHPPLGLLAALAGGDATPEMAGVLELTDQLEADLPSMLAEHKTVVEALQRLRDAAQRAGRAEIVDFAQQLIHHARAEEEVMYPAAILVGKFVRERLHGRGSK